MSQPRAHIITASAGAGKTYRLAYKYIYDALCDREAEGKPFQPDAFRHTLAVTFTNKATQEMKSRILNRLNELATGKECEYTEDLVRDLSVSEAVVRQRAAEVRSAILHNYSHFAIMTNDTFFQRIMRAFVRELGAEPNYAVELDTQSIISRATDDIISELNHSKGGAMYRWILKIMEQHILEGSTWNIRNEILKLQKELFKEQGDTLSKISTKEDLERIVGNYIKEGEASLREMKALATECAAEIEARDYLQYFKGKSRSGPGYFRTIARDAQTLEMSATVRNSLYNDVSEWCGVKQMPADFMTFATRLQKALQRVAPYYSLKSTVTLLKQNYHSFALMNDLYNKSIEICREENLMLLSETKQTIGDFICESDVPFIYEKIGNTFERYMIDEFQDTSLREWKNFLPLLRNALSQSVDISVLLVGDIKQSIYRWRGSDWNILGSIAPHDISEGGIARRHETLDGNYRSLPEIVNFNNALFESIIADENHRLNTLIQQAYDNKELNREQYDRLFDATKNAYTGHRQIPKRKSQNPGYVALTAHCEKMPNICQTIYQAIDRGYKPCDIVILARYKKDTYAIVDELLRNSDNSDAKYQFNIMTEEALLIANSPAVRFIIAAMRLAIDPRATIERAIYNQTLYDDYLHEEQPDELQLLHQLQNRSAEEAFEEIVMHFGDRFPTQTIYIEALHEAIHRFAAGKSADLQMFLKWWNESGNSLSVNSESSERSIEIMTIHKAKGLEKKMVIIPLCDWPLDPKTGSVVWAHSTTDKELTEAGYYPIAFSKAVGSSQFANAYYTELVYSHIENLNLLYVALTRAAEELHIFIKKSVDKHGKSSDNGIAPHNRVNKLLYNCDMFHFPKDGIDDQPLCFLHGELRGVEPFEERASESEILYLDSYKSSPIELKMTTNASRYNDDDRTISPRSQGIKLHKALEDSQTPDDIFAALANARIDGTLSDEEYDAIAANVNQALSQKPVSEWFDGSWQSVRNEQSILDKSQGVKRPDRVMIKGRRAVVVDYKFGERLPSHQDQIDAYCQLLRKMGYDDVQGYVWYLREGIIV